MSEPWLTRHIREFAERIRDINSTGEDLEPLSVTKDLGVVLQSTRFKKRVATNLGKYQIARRGDFVFDPMSMYYGSIGRLDVIDKGAVSPDYVVFGVDSSVDSRFMLYLLRSEKMRARYESLSELGNRFGKRRRLYWSVFRDIALRIPPLPEQRKIAAILSSVDETIEKTEAVIAQLQVVKKAMMQALLTRGLPGRHTRFKKTELGDIPEEWELRPLHTVAQVQTGIAKGKKADGDAMEVSYLRVANVQDGFLDLRDIKTLSVDARALERYALQKGDVLFTEGGDADKLGRGCVWHAPIEPCLHQNHVFAARPNRTQLIPEFLSYFGGSPAGKRYFLDCAKQTTNLASINSTQLKSLPVPIPSLDEQQGITEAIHAVERRMETERHLAEGVRSVKNALMSALLTGQIRVTPGEATS